MQVVQQHWVKCTHRKTIPDRPFAQKVLYM